jgi:hypothetical protein
MSSSQQASPILRLPVELREQINVDVLLAPGSDVTLLRVCRQIYTESYPLIFKRPLSFASQSSLSRWLDLVGPQHLHHVNAVTLQLQDISLSPLLSLAPMPGLLCWELYEQELEGIRVALRNLPNVRSLTLARSTPHQLQSYLYREFLSAFCTLLAHSCTHLTHLTLHEDIPHVAFHPNLRSIRLVGFSDARAAAALSHLSSLPALSDVQLVTEDLSHSSRGPYNQRQLLNSDEKAIPAALQTLPPLSAFTIQESPTSPSLLTPALLAALASHAPTLTTLRVFVSCTPSFTTLSALHALLSSQDCKVKRLELCWPDVDPDSLESLIPQSVERLTVSVEGCAHAFDVLWAVIQRKSEATGLRAVTVAGEWEEGCGELRLGDEVSLLFSVC